MRIAIVQFPGSNCERETMLAVKRAGMTPVPFFWNAPAETLSDMDGYIIVGGFSYEDRGRAGIIAAQHPIIDCIKAQSVLGKPVLGICNGAQILVETGLVPGFKNYPLSMALTDNKRMMEGSVLGTGFYNAWVHLKPAVDSRPNAFTRLLKHGTTLHIPCAHAQGRFLIPPAVLDSLHQHGLIALQYCDGQGEIDASFPVNPNGSVDNIAAISNHAGNVMAIMPHPERTAAGDAIFQSMREYIAEGYLPSPEPPSMQLPPVQIPVYQPASGTHTMIVGLVINDNASFSLEKALAGWEEKPRIQRREYWEIRCDSKSVLHQIQASGVLYNDQKEFLVSNKARPGQRSLLVKAREDMLGLQKMQHLRRHFGINGLDAVTHGVLWQIETDCGALDSAIDKITASSLLFNPLSHECYEYEY